MTNPAILEALVKAISAAYDDALMHGEREAAAAVLELVGPRKLVWVQIHGRNDGFSIYHATHPITGLKYSYGTDRNGDSYWTHSEMTKFVEIDSGQEAAQAAAQAHADAAHWANTKIWGE